MLLWVCVCVCVWVCMTFARIHFDCCHICDDLFLWLSWKSTLISETLSSELKEKLSIIGGYEIYRSHSKIIEFSVNFETFKHYLVGTSMGLLFVGREVSVWAVFRMNPYAACMLRYCHRWQRTRVLPEGIAKSVLQFIFNIVCDDVKTYSINDPRYQWKLHRAKAGTYTVCSWEKVTWNAVRFPFPHQLSHFQPAQKFLLQRFIRNTTLFLLISSQLSHLCHDTSIKRSLWKT